MQLIHWEIEVILFVFLISAALIALNVRDLLAAVVTLGVYSFLLALLFVAMGAVDVGFTEAVVGAGVTTLLFIAALFHTSRKTPD